MGVSLAFHNGYHYADRSTRMEGERLVMAAHPDSWVATFVVARPQISAGGKQLEGRNSQQNMAGLYLHILPCSYRFALGSATPADIFHRDAVDDHGSHPDRNHSTLKLVNRRRSNRTGNCLCKLSDYSQLAIYDPDVIVDIYLCVDYSGPYHLCKTQPPCLNRSIHYSIPN